MRVYLVDGTYELFRQFFGQPRRASVDGREIGAARGVVLSILGMLESGDTYLGVATDHVIESFRNELWPGYKTGEGVEPELRAQFQILEDALSALGVTVWPMVEFEADDALAAAAASAAGDGAVEQVVICTPDKDLSQCVEGERVVQLDRRTNTVRDEGGVWEKFGVAPRSIPDWLAVVGDSADGFPGLPGWGPRAAAAVLSHYGTLGNVPDRVADWDPSVRGALRGAERLANTLASQRELAELFRELATLRIDSIELGDVSTLRWSGPTTDLGEIAALFRDPSLADRAAAAARG